MSTLQQEAASFGEQLVRWRRTMHQNPELSGEESQTAAWIAEQLRELGYDPRVVSGDGHGVIAELDVAPGKPAVALRADIDALPIHEDTGVEYASRNPGAMHACGHDAHTAMLLGAARLLRSHEKELKRSVRLIFQPHEEQFPGGAPTMIENGALDNIERIFGIHIWSHLPTGVAGMRAGAFMAAVNPFRIRIVGKGGHAAMPDTCIDPVVTAANTIMALQTIVSRNVPITEAAVVSVTAVNGGTADNVIPGEVKLLGTIRTFDATIRDRVCRRVEEIVTSTAAMHGARAELRMDAGYPVLVNDESVLNEARGAAERIGLDPQRFEALMPQGGGEDFAYYCEKVPGTFVFLGANNPAKDCIHPHHHPKFNIDEDALPWGAAWHAQFALDAGREA